VLSPISNLFVFSLLITTRPVFTGRLTKGLNKNTRMLGYTLKAWKEKGKYIDWQGHEIFYVDEPNDKENLILIHGFPTASFDWHKIWDELSLYYNIIAIDMLGFGFSDKPKNMEYTISNQADLIVDILKAKGIINFHILAHDYGDTVAQEIIARYNNDEVDFELLSVVLLNGGLFPETHKALFIQKLLIGPLGFMLSRLLNKKKLGKSFEAIFGDKTQCTSNEIDEYWELVSYKNGHHIAYKLARYMTERISNRERWVGGLQDYSKPLYLINGPVDPISGMHMVDRFKEIVSEENVFVLEGIGHYPQVEAPADILSILINKKSQAI